MNKPRSDSVLDAMPENQREALEEWLFEENLSYADAQKRLLADFGVRCSRSGLCAFYQRTAEKRLLANIQESARKANSVVQRFQENPSDNYKAVLNMVGQIAFEASLKENGLDPELLFNFTKLVIAGKDRELKAQKLALDERRVKLLEEKAAKAEAAEGTLKDTTLTPEEKQARIREIFGLPN